MAATDGWRWSVVDFAFLGVGASVLPAFGLRMIWSSSIAISINCLRISVPGRRNACMLCAVLCCASYHVCTRQDMCPIFLCGWFLGKAKGLLDHACFYISQKEIKRNVCFFCDPRNSKQQCIVTGRQQQGHSLIFQVCMESIGPLIKSKSLKCQDFLIYPCHHRSRLQNKVRSRPEHKKPGLKRPKTGTVVARLFKPMES